MIGRFCKWKYTHDQAIKHLMTNPIPDYIVINQPFTYMGIKYSQSVNMCGNLAYLNSAFGAYWKRFGKPSMDLTIIAGQIDKFLTKMRKLQAFT